jgi:hypothetical protein
MIMAKPLLYISQHYQYPSEALSLALCTNYIDYTIPHLAEFR